MNLNLNNEPEDMYKDFFKISVLIILGLMTIEIIEWVLKN